MRGGHCGGGVLRDDDGEKHCSTVEHAKEVGDDGGGREARSEPKDPLAHLTNGGKCRALRGPARRVPGRALDHVHVGRVRVRVFVRDRLASSHAPLGVTQASLPGSWVGI